MEPGRVTAVWPGKYQVATPRDTGNAEMSGKLRHQLYHAARRPAIGDWVAIREIGNGDWLIQAVLPRHSCLQRQKVDGDVEAQVIAANVDICLIVQALEGDYNPARLDRYIALAQETAVQPVVVLTKADLAPAADEMASQVQQAHADVDVHVVSAIDGTGLDQLQQALLPGKNHVAVGSSGVGKSTLVNLLSGQQLMKTGDVRQDDSRGRHTTSHRQMFMLPGGALFIDTPGIRELALFAHSGLGNSFQDIEQLARQCKFNDCTHQDEPQCAVRAAIENGQLPRQRLDNFRKMQREAHLEKQKQILLNKKMSKKKIKRSKVHYKDFVRGASKEW